MRWRLLIADDEESVTFPLRLYFERRGYDVDVADSLSQARALVEETRYDIVITDLRLDESGGEGLELARHVGAIYPKTQTILLTAGDTVRLHRGDALAGVARVLTKPIALAELAETVDQLLGEQ